MKNPKSIPAGSLTNKGIEFSLDGEILRNSKGWSWSLGANIGFNKSKIGDLGFEPTDFGMLKNVRGYEGAAISDHFGIANLFIAGMAPGIFYGYKMVTNSCTFITTHVFSAYRNQLVQIPGLQF